MTSPGGEPIFDYAKVMAIFVGCVFAYVLLITFIGPERKSVSFEEPVDEDIEINEKIKHNEEIEAGSNLGTSRA